MFRDTYKGYKNHSIKALLANLEAGKQYPETGDSQDTQANSLCKVNRLEKSLWQMECQIGRGWGYMGAAASGSQGLAAHCAGMLLFAP